MSKFNIGNINGSGNVMGDNNNVVNTRLSNEVVIRDEASRFTEENLDALWCLSGGHIDFINRTNKALLYYYTRDSKSIYLDQVLMSVNQYWSAFCKNNTNSEDFYDVYSKVVFFIEQEIEQLPKIIRQPDVQSSSDRTTVFICYAHADSSHLKDLKRHFKSFEKLIDFWDDTRIQPGDKWKDAIDKAMRHAKIAILLVSADFFNSEFINNNELPRLLEKSSKDGAKIISVILKPCVFEEHPDINQFQAINFPNKPVISMNENEREEIWVQLVKEIKKSIST